MTWGGLSQSVLDRVGGCVSTACAIHCALEPLLILLPSIASIEFLLGETLERVFLAGGLTLALLSVVYGLRQHGDRRILGSFLVGVSLVTLGQVGFAGSWRTVFVVPGGLTIAATHLLNVQFRRTTGRTEECGRSEPSLRPGPR